MSRKIEHWVIFSRSAAPFPACSQMAATAHRVASCAGTKKGVSIPSKAESTPSTKCPQDWVTRDRTDTAPVAYIVSECHFEPSLLTRPQIFVSQLAIGKSFSGQYCVQTAGVMKEMSDSPTTGACPQNQLTIRGDEGPVHRTFWPRI